jgi:biopolymer transport protein ExbD
LIDLVFLLLAFFLVTTALLEPESRIAAALGGEGREQVMVPPVEVVVSTDGWTIGTRHMHTAEALGPVLAALPPGTGVVVTVRGAPSAGAIIAALREARTNGIVQVQLRSSNP